MKPALIGIDIGGTSVKSIICDQRGRVLALVKKPTTEAYRSYGGGSQRDLNSEALWSVVRSAVRESVGRLTREYKPVSVAVSAVGCTMLMFDKNDRQICICEDESTLEKEYSELCSLYDESAFEHITGYPRDRSLSGLHLTGYCKNAQKSGIAKILSVDDFIVYKLTGIYNRNYSTAASNGMWDSNKGCWLDFLKDGTGLTDEVLGRPGNSGSKAGKISECASAQTGLSTDVTVASGGMDYQCAAFAVKSIIGRGLFNVSGTVDLVAFYGEISDLEKNLYTIRDYHVIPGVKSQMMETIGASQTEWLKNNVVSQKKYGFSLDWGQYFDGLGLEYDACPFCSEIYIPQSFGGLHSVFGSNPLALYGGLNDSTDSQALLRAMLVGMAYSTKQMADCLSFADKKKELVLAGGGGRDNAWAQIKADVTGRDILIPEIEEASALGAALLGGIGCGVYEDHEEAADVLSNIPCRHIRHNESRSRYYDDMFDEVYSPLIDIWQKINKKISTINEKHKKERFI